MLSSGRGVPEGSLGEKCGVEKLVERAMLPVKKELETIKHRLGSKGGVPSRNVDDTNAMKLSIKKIDKSLKKLQDQVYVHGFPIRISCNNTRGSGQKIAESFPKGSEGIIWKSRCDTKWSHCHKDAMESRQWQIQCFRLWQSKVLVRIVGKDDEGELGQFDGRWAHDSDHNCNERLHIWW